MKTNFRMTGISDDYGQLFTLDQTQLAEKGGIRMIVDKKPGYPCRISLEDADIGEEVILFPYKHHQAKSPYQASGPVFVRKNAQKANLAIGEVPQMLLVRLLSLRVYDAKGMMIDAATVQGSQLAEVIESIFQHAAAAYIHVHNAGPGCFNCQVDRAN